MTTAKPRVALHEFMPYGAPDLLQSERDHLSRALLASTLLLTLSCLALGLVLPRLAARGEPELPWSHDVSTTIVRPPLLPPPSIAEVPLVAPAAPSTAAHGGDVVPVSDDRADPVATLPSQDDLAHSGPVATDTHGTGTTDVPLAPEVPPTPDQFVPVDEMPTLVQRARPVYPELARDAGVEGTVVVQALIGKDGRVAEVRIQPGRSIPLLDEAALAAVKAFVFTPALANGHPVMVWVRQPVVFRLH